MSLSFNLGNSTQRALDGAIMSCVRDAVEFLAEKHGFNAAEALAEMNLTKTTTTTKKTSVPKTKALRPSVPLPFCGTLLSTCNAIRVNHGLHSQCLNPKSTCDISGGQLEYCKTCNKQAMSNESGTPSAGDIRSRISGEWSIPNKLVRYGNVMEKLGISRSKAEEEAAKLGLTIPEEEFEVVKGRRGRPKKDASASSSEDDTPKKRGRPKKEKKVIDTNAGDDLISQLVAQAAAETTSSESETESVSEIRASKEAEKAAKLQAKEAEKAAKLQAKEAEKAAKLEAKEAEKAAKLEAKEAEKAAKLEAKEAEKAAKLEAKEAEKAAKLEAKEAEKAAKLEAKEAEKAAKLSENTEVENSAADDLDTEELGEEKVFEMSSSDEESEDEETSITATRKTINGKMYIMAKENNHLYDEETHEPLGTYYNSKLDEIMSIEEDV